MNNSTTTIQDSSHQLLDLISGLSILETLALLANRCPGQVTFSTSFSFEDQVIAHHILSSNIPVSIFTLDTGRLFAEPYSARRNTNSKYATHAKAYYPDRGRLERDRTGTRHNALH